MKATRHNGRAGQKGTYNVKHNDRNFDVKNSEHIDEARVAQNVYWDCYQGYCFAGSDEPRKPLILLQIKPIPTPNLQRNRRILLFSIIRKIKPMRLSTHRLIF